MVGVGGPPGPLEPRGGCRPCVLRAPPHEALRGTERSAMAERKRLKPSEYGGADTQRTDGIQPAPHRLTATEQLRTFYQQDPLDIELDIPEGIGEVILPPPG